MLRTSLSPRFVQYSIHAVGMEAVAFEDSVADHAGACEVASPALPPLPEPGALTSSPLGAPAAGPSHVSQFYCAVIGDSLRLRVSRLSRARSSLFAFVGIVAL
jgi:hypothetical protein